jgi:glycosyltransferase involved in cell wall biosynthesis
MKIIEIIPNLNSGGAEKFVVDITNELSSQGYDATLLTLYETSGDDILQGFLKNDVHRVSLGKQLGFDLKCLIQLYKYICKEKPDVVHAHTGGITYLILSAFLYRRCKYFVTIHNDAKVDAGSGIRKIIRNVLIKFRLVTPITISEESEISFQRFYGLKGNLILNGCAEYHASEIIDESKYRQGVDFLFIHVGRFQIQKNQMCLVRAFDKLLHDGVKARLILIGRKEDEYIYNNVAPYFSDNIVYLGEQKNPRDYVKISDAFCMSSAWEGMPITIIEAFSVGCPAIVTPAGGCVNMVENGVNGFLATEISEESYYQALKKYTLLDKSTRETMSQNAFNSYKKNYSIERTTKNYVKLFNSEK